MAFVPGRLNASARRNATQRVSVRLGLALLAAVCVAAAACAKSRASETSDRQKKVRAKVVTVEQRELRRDVESVGSLFAYDEVAVSSEVEGRVERVLVDVGDRVALLQPLVRVSPVELQFSLDQQKAALQQVRAQLGLRDGEDDLKDLREAAEVKRAAADLADGEQKFNRARSLYDDGLIPRGTFDEAEAHFKAVRAAYELSLQSVENLRAELRARQAAAALAEKKLADAVIRAPFAGQVKERSVTQGQYLKVQTPVMTLVNIDPLRVRLKVPEKVAGWISVGQPVSVTVEAYPGRTFAGKLSRMNPAVDPQTRSLEVEALLENHEGLLKPGFFAKARVASSQVDSVLLVPHDAVRYVFGVYKIYTVEGNALHEQDIKIGDRNGDAVEIVSGLQDRQKVAIPLEGQEPRDGALVDAVSQP